MFTASLFSIIASMSTLTATEDTKALQTLQECTILKQDTARLACYDAVMKSAPLQTNQNKKNHGFGLSPEKSSSYSPQKPTSPDRPSKDRTATQQGKEAPADAEEVIKNLLRQHITQQKEGKNQHTFEVLAHKRGKDGKYIFEMKDGSVWMQTDSFYRPLREKEFTVTIKKNSFGSYMLRPQKGRWSIRVKRNK